jgi:hypothetical protein
MDELTENNLQQKGAHTEHEDKLVTTDKTEVETAKPGIILLELEADCDRWAHANESSPG